MLKEFEKKRVVTIDLHEYSVIDAKQKLQMLIKSAPKETKEIVVIHGYHRGNALLYMVRKEFKNKRVKKKYLSLNPGVTSLILKSDF